MKRFRNAASTLALILTTLPITGAHSQTPRDSVARLRGTVSGRVDIEEDEQHAPIRRATITLREIATGQVSTTSSDRDGRYRFDDVPSGDYRVLAQKPGFLSAPVDRRTTGALTVNLSMHRAGAIEGRFIDAQGDPVDRLTVIAELLADAPAATPITGTFSAATDDLGRFRIHTLPPGHYRVYATAPPPASGDKVFYPGTSAAAEASLLHVVSGQTVDGLEFTVPSAPLSPIAAEALAAYDRDGSTTSTSGAPAARIAGRVTRSDTGQPIRNATADLGSVAGARVSTRNVALTNADGRFEFKGLASGEYTLTVNANGFINSDGSLMRPGGAGTRIVVKDGEQNDRTNVVLTRTSAIEGFILDEFGDPAPGIVYQVTVQGQLGTLRAFMTGSAVGIATTGPTDDRGWFRAFGLFAGDYYVIALPEPFERSGPASFATTLFPGTSSADSALPIHIVSGMDAHDVRFKLVAAGASSVAGVVADAAGRPLSKAQVDLLPTDNGDVRVVVHASVTTADEGTFSYQAVPDGNYVLQGSADGLFGSRLVTFSATDPIPRSLALTLHRRTTARGRISFEGDVASQPAAGGVLVEFKPTDFTRGPIGSNSNVAQITSDWTFAIPNLASSGYLRAIAPAGWALARVQLDGRDITDTPYDFQSADVKGLDVVLTNRLGSVTGTVLSGGQPAAGATVVMFGADSSAAIYIQRTSRSARSNDHGTFSLTGVLPGRYFAVAFAQSAQMTPPSLLTLRSVATPLVVSDRANAPLALTLIK